MWKGERVWPDDPVEGTKREKERLMSVDQAYDDSKPTADKPTAENTKAEIKQYLDDNGIDYDSDALKDELLELV